MLKVVPLQLFGVSFLCYFLRVEATIKDGSKLFIREYVSEREHIYSYHWQDREERLRIR
jgi:hypothetical protein